MISLYIARDADWYDEDTKVKGDIHLFYDTPLFVENNKEGKRNGNMIWDYARVIGEVPNYMYPELKGGECIKLQNLK